MTTTLMAVHWLTMATTSMSLLAPTATTIFYQDLSSLSFRPLLSLSLLALFDVVIPLKMYATVTEYVHLAIRRWYVYDNLIMTTTRTKKGLLFEFCARNNARKVRHKQRSCHSARRVHW